MNIKTFLQPKSSRKLYFSVLITYIVLLVVALSTLAIGYSYSIQKTKRDMESLQISYLNLICRELDTRLNAVSKISDFLATSPLTQLVSKIEEEDVEYQLDFRSLNEVIAEQNALIFGEGESFVYFEASDSVLTGEYRYRSINLDAFFSQLGLTKQEFLEILYHPSVNGSLHILHPGTQNAELIYMVSVLDGNYQTVGAVVTRLSLSYLRNVMNIESWINGSICHMQNRDECFCIDDGGYGNALLGTEIPDYSEVPLNGSLVETDIQGVDYMTVGIHSSVNSWRYYFSIPTEEFHRTNRFFILLFVIVLAISLLCGLFLSFSFSRHLARPIQEILDKFSPNTAMAFPEAMNTLERAMTTYRKELTDTRNRLHQRFRRDKEDFVYGICTGRIAPLQAETGLKEYGISLGDANMFLLQFWYHGIENSVFSQDGVLNLDLLLYASCNVIEELLCQEHGVVFSRENQTFCLCQSFAQDEIDLLQAKLEDICQFHREVLHVELNILCAGCISDLTELPDMMSRLEDMARYKAFWGQDVPNILFYEEVSDLTNFDGTTDYLGTEKRFINLLAIRDYESAHELLIKQLDFGISKNMERFKMDRLKVFSLISSLLETMAVEMNGTELEQMKTILQDLLTEPSLSGLKEKTDVLFQMIISHKEQAHDEDTPGWVHEIRKYIEEHYDNPQLDVSFLAREFSLNVSHLSRTYKKITSIGVLDNIHMVRIIRAKELLNQRTSVQDTSIRVGYQEPRALIRAFKRYEGITPGQYQEIVLKQNVQ